MGSTTGLGAVTGAKLGRGACSVACWVYDLRQITVTLRLLPPFTTDQLQQLKFSNWTLTTCQAMRAL